MLLPFALVALWSFVAAQDQWCGKNYMKNQPSVNPGGQFKQPATSQEPRINFRCWPLVQPFLEGETDASFIIDVGLVNLEIPGSQPFPKSIDTNGQPKLDVTIKAGRTTLASGVSVTLNTTGSEIPFTLKSLPVSMSKQNITCSATISSTTFTTRTSVQHLPQPTGGGSVVKTDFRTGALLVRPGGSPANASFEPLMPLGFYTDFDTYLVLNLSKIDQAKASGRNTIHPTPPTPEFTNLTVLNEVLQRMEEQKMWLMYDMRNSFMNLTSVKEQTERIKNFPYLLVWYTADEPDGWQYDHNSTLLAGDLISSIDAYHPVSLVLNCFDYFFEEYTQGATIILQDTYTIDINATFSRVWGTVCNDTLGDCGCDDCTGSFDDVTTRVDLFNQRFSVDGRSRGSSVWSVPQGFGNESYWPRYPTPNEFVLQSIIGLTHGSLGIVSWDEQAHMPPELLASAGILGANWTTITSFLTSPNKTYTNLRMGDNNAVDLASWKIGDQVLVLAGNMQNNDVNVDLSGVASGGMTEILNTGVQIGDGSQLKFGPLSSVGLLIQTNVTTSTSSKKKGGAIGLHLSITHSNLMMISATLLAPLLVYLTM